jgi:hypothetical protein
VLNKLLLNPLNVLNLQNQLFAKDAKKKNLHAVAQPQPQHNYVKNAHSLHHSVFALKKIVVKNVTELLVFAARNAHTFHALAHHPHVLNALNHHVVVKFQNQL